MESNGRSEKSKNGRDLEITDDIESEIDALKQENRGAWGSPAEFILSCLGYAVGLGNVWRFPYLVYENGGGAFLIPYIIMMTFVGVPLFLIELSIGQYGRGGSYTAWAKLSPLFKGVGLGMILITFMSNIYYQMIIAWSLYYLFATFQRRLPWARCDNDFNTEFCYAKAQAEDTCENNGDDAAVFYNQVCYSGDMRQNNTDIYSCTIYDMEKCADNATQGSYNCSLDQFLQEFSTCKRSGAGEEFFNLGMLKISGDIEDNGEMLWQVVLVLLLSWIICYLCVIKGIQSSGKVVYFTATFPYLILIILLVRGVTLEGAKEGIKFYLIPEWSDLARPKVWADAAGQVFFSLSVGLGGLMSYASYNKFHNNVYRDTLIVTIADALTAFFAGFAIFSTLGHLAMVLNKEVKDVVNSGSGLAFIAYPEVMSYLPVSHLWCILFFLMLLTLGLDSQFAGLENIDTFIMDLFPRLRTKKWLVALAQCSVCFLLGLTMCSQAGKYWEELIGYYSQGWSLILIALAEVSIVAFIYRTSNFLRDVQVMVGFELWPHWWSMISLVAPALMVFILAFNCYEFVPLTYGDYEFQTWAQVLGWLMAVVSVVVIPIMAIHTIAMSYWKGHYKGVSFCKRLYLLMKPSPEWRLVEELEGPKSETLPSYVDAVREDGGWDAEGPYGGSSNPGYSNDGRIPSSSTRL